MAKTDYLYNFEYLGRLIDGSAAADARYDALCKLNNSQFRECLLTAMHAVFYFK